MRGGWLELWFSSGFLVVVFIVRLGSCEVMFGGGVG